MDAVDENEASNVACVGTVLETAEREIYYPYLARKNQLGYSSNKSELGGKTEPNSTI